MGIKKKKGELVISKAIMWQEKDEKPFYVKEKDTYETDSVTIKDSYVFNYSDYQSRFKFVEKLKKVKLMWKYL